MVKIGAELPKLSKNEAEYLFLDHPVSASKSVFQRKLSDFRCLDTWYDCVEKLADV